MASLDIDLSQVRKILEAPIEKLHDMSCVELGVAAVVLAQFAFEIQYHENRCKAFLRFASRIGRNRNQFQRLVDKAEEKIALTAFMTRRVEEMGRCLMNLQKAKEKGI